MHGERTLIHTTKNVERTLIHTTKNVVQDEKQSYKKSNKRVLFI